MTVYKKAGAGTPAINRRSDLLIKSASDSSTWDRNLQDRMNQSGAPRGERNIEMVKLACDIVWAGSLSESEHSISYAIDMKTISKIMKSEVSFGGPIASPHPERLKHIRMNTGKQDRTSSSLSGTGVRHPIR